ncbi:hypothetical protein P7K49_013011 [Saguinus oedipus]|uniref:Uncharacterized protein n=1 Tax=Saguinus oedipus TaxID=9490 RepID=A0ABQ9VEN9_SAGOE|nr:hypothetical protein P7K49_013011 [Saguinus oedipus]
MQEGEKMQKKILPSSLQSSPKSLILTLSLVLVRGQILSFTAAQGARTKFWVTCLLSKQGLGFVLFEAPGSTQTGDSLGPRLEVTLGTAAPSPRSASAPVPATLSQRTGSSSTAQSWPRRTPAPARARTHRLRQPQNPYSSRVSATVRASETPRALESRTPARQGAGPADARPFTCASLTPPEAGAASVTARLTAALTTAGAVRVEKLQVLRRCGGSRGRQEHEELVSVSDLYLRRGAGAWEPT